MPDLAALLDKGKTKHIFGTKTPAAHRNLQFVG
jgi:hypothetical protein